MVQQRVQGGIDSWDWAEVHSNCCLRRRPLPPHHSDRVRALHQLPPSPPPPQQPASSSSDVHWSVLRGQHGGSVKTSTDGLHYISGAS